MQGIVKSKPFMYSPAVSNGTWGEKKIQPLFKNTRRASSVFKEERNFNSSKKVNWTLKEEKDEAKVLIMSYVNMSYV